MVRRWSVDTLRLNIYRDPMNVELTPDQRAVIRRAIETGRGLGERNRPSRRRWRSGRERERRRLELVAALDEAEASLARGEGRTINPDSLNAFADEIKQRGRRRIETQRFSGR